MVEINTNERSGIFSDRSLIPPCQVACPLHMDIRQYVDLVSQGKIMEALHVIRNDNPFPSICAYVCTHPCEESCRRGQVDNSLAIRALKRFAVEFGGDRLVQAKAETIHAEKVAIVGSGPAGLSCAYYLRKLGYPATIFEAYSELGGMLRVGIPQYRLPREVLDNEVRRLTQMGVEIRTNTRVISLDLLFELGYKAIFITIGAHQSLRLEVEGEETPGVIDGATFLREINLGLKPEMGRSVAVVGGGNVAIDAARTAVRLGVRKVQVLYRRGRDEMPADPAEVQLAMEEGIKIDFLITPTRIKRNSGRLMVTCVRMKLGEPDDSGRRRPEPVKGSSVRREFDTLITAIGQAPQTPGDFGVRIGKGSTIQVDPVTMTTNRTGVYAGGDAVTGPSTVTSALAAGRLAASRIDDYLQHRYPKVEKTEKESLSGDLLPETIEIIKKTERMEPPKNPLEVRTKELTPDELVYDWGTAINEARRCLRCGMGAEILFQDKCASCLTCLRVCPYHIPYLDDSGTVKIPIEQCQACGICISECPARAIVLRRPKEQNDMAEALEFALKSAVESNRSPFVIGFCCQYGLFGTGMLADLWHEPRNGVWIVPVPCVAKVGTGYMLHAFENGADGVFIAGCGEQCSRENTSAITNQRIRKVRQVLEEVDLEPERISGFFPDGSTKDPAEEVNTFIENVSGFYLESLIKQEVKS